MLLEFEIFEIFTKFQFDRFFERQKSKNPDFIGILRFSPKLVGTPSKSFLRNAKNVHLN